MKSYSVRIKMCAIKTIEVSANSEDEATELAHELSSMAGVGELDDYFEDTVGVSEIPYNEKLPQFEEDNYLEV